MDTTIISAIVSVIGSILTLIGVIYTTNRSHEKTVEKVDQKVDMMNQKFDMTVQEIKKDINNLEVKQDKHNGLIERMFCAEKSIELLDERQKVANHRIDDLEKRG